MKNLILVCGLILSLNAFAGNERGNGGNAVVCRDKDGNIKSAEMLDIYEGRALSGLKYNEFTGSVDQNFDRIIDDILEPSHESTKLMIYSVKNNMTMLPTGVELEPINDSLHILMPRNCKVEQVANFYNQTKVFVNSDIFNSFNDLSKTALYLHEVLYLLDRQAGSTNSRSVRRVVAKALSDGFQLDHPWTTPVVNGALACFTTKGKSTFFFATPAGNDEWTFQFTRLNGHLVFSKKSATVHINREYFPVSSMEPDRTTYMTQDLSSKIDDGDIITLSFSSDSMKISWIGYDTDEKVTNESFICTTLQNQNL